MSSIARRRRGQGPETDQKGEEKKWRGKGNVGYC